MPAQRHWRPDLRPADDGTPGHRDRYLCVMTSLALDSAAIASTVELAGAGDEARLRPDRRRPTTPTWSGSPSSSCGDRDLAEDAAQAAWWIAWRKLRLAARPRPPPPWLVAVAANEARQLLRRRAPAPVVELDVAARAMPGRRSRRRDRAGRPGERARPPHARGPRARRPALRRRPRLGRARRRPSALAVRRAHPPVPGARPPPEGARR